MKLNVLSHMIIGGAMQVHTALGSGLLERAYQLCLAYELRLRGLVVDEEVPVPVVYKGTRIELGYRIDLVVEKRVAIEVKAISELLPVHRSQVLTQVKFSGLQLGLLINFHEAHLKDGITRIINAAPSSSEFLREPLSTLR